MTSRCPKCKMPLPRVVIHTFTGLKDEPFYYAQIKLGELTVANSYGSYPTREAAEASAREEWLRKTGADLPVEEVTL